MVNAFADCTRNLIFRWIQVTNFLFIAINIMTKNWWWRWWQCSCWSGPREVKKWKFSAFHCGLHPGLNIWMICGCDLDPWRFVAIMLVWVVEILMQCLYFCWYYTVDKENRILVPCGCDGILALYMLWPCVCLSVCHKLVLYQKWLYIGYKPSTSYSIHFFTQSLSSFRKTWPYHRNLFCCCTKIISSIPSLSLNFLLGTLSFTLTLHIHLTILISARWSATSFSFLPGHVSLLCSILLSTQLLYGLPLLISDISLLVSSGANCLNLFNPIPILASTAASVSPSTLNISPR